MPRLGGLDLGTRAGYVVAEVDVLPFEHDAELHIERASFYDLKRAKEIAGSVGRWRGYRTLLSEYMGECDAVFFEDVPEAAHTGAGAARVHGGLRATLELWAADNKRRIQGVSIQAAKRALTGTGAAPKKLMKGGAWARFKVSDPTNTGDVADALGVLLAGLKRLSAGEYAWAQKSLC